MVSGTMCIGNNVYIILPMLFFVVRLKDEQERGDGWDKVGFNHVADQLLFFFFFFWGGGGGGMGDTVHISYSQSDTRLSEIHGLSINYIM